MRFWTTIPLLLSWAFLQLLSHGTRAQSNDAVQLKPVIIRALPFEKYMPGSRVGKADSLALETAGQGSLADVLSQNSTVYIKEHGNSMLASISFRGTGASHTGVFWHGLNLNALTLGQSDFNNINLFLFDNLSIQYGGAGSLHGSDAIGGSIHLGTTPGLGRGVQLELRQDIGSFGNAFTGMKMDLKNSNWSSKTRVFNFVLKNNFKYQITDRLGDVHEVTQQNAGVHDYAVLQEFQHHLNAKNKVFLKAWYQHNYQEVQPMMVSQATEDQAGQDLLDRNLRLLTGYNRIMRTGELMATVGYFHENQLYDERDRIATRRLLALLDQELDIGGKTTFKLGGNTQYIRPEVHSYAPGVSEWRSDVYASVVHNLKPGWQLALNARKSFVPKMEPPLAPSISTRYQTARGSSAFTFRTQAGRSYRIPTLNDRYWERQGRDDLEAEHGYSLEVGHNYRLTKDHFVLEGDISAYMMSVDNWIAWLPEGNLWRPHNMKEVSAKGIELFTRMDWKTFLGTASINGHYTYTRSVLVRGVDEKDPAAGYQLPYTPVHRAVLSGHLTYRLYRLSVVNQFTGMRRGQDVINDLQDPYFLTNIVVGKNLSLGGHTIVAQVQIRNVINTVYQNVRRYAMPGRNYLVSLRYVLSAEK